MKLVNKGGLSAGRVQSVAVKLITQRKEEIVILAWLVVLKLVHLRRSRC